MPQGVHIPEVFRHVWPAGTFSDLLRAAQLLGAVHLEVKIDNRAGHDPSAVPGTDTLKRYREREMQDVERLCYSAGPVDYCGHAGGDDPFDHKLARRRFRLSRERNRPKTILRVLYPWFLPFLSYTGMGTGRLAVSGYRDAFFRAIAGDAVRYCADLSLSERWVTTPFVHSKQRGSDFLLLQSSAAHRPADAS